MECGEFWFIIKFGLNLHLFTVFTLKFIKLWLFVRFPWIQSVWQKGPLRRYYFLLQL